MVQRRREFQQPDLDGVGDKHDDPVWRAHERQSGRQSAGLACDQNRSQNTLDFESWLDWIEITGVDPYAEWANSEGLASLDRTADEDLDTVDNFTEWAVGGDPNNPNDKGLPGSGFIWDNDGTNVFSFIIPRQTNWYPNGVNYNFEGNDNLIAASSWTNVYPWDWNPVDSGGYNAEFDAVTNYFSGTNSLVNVDSNETYFIRLRVDHRSYNP